MYQTEGCQQCGSSRCGSVLPHIYPKFIGEYKAKSISKRKKERKGKRVNVLGKFKYTEKG